MRRRLNYESLEQRQVLSASSVLADYVDIENLEVQPTYTSFDSPANHVTATGSKFNGVVKLTMQTDAGTFLGSGTLLPTGRHILTAAHNVTGADNLQFTTLHGVSALFELPGGNVTRTVSLVSINVHPGWDPDNVGAGSDLAVLELTTDAPAEATPFDIFRASSELQSIGEKAGYGQAGQGVVTIGAGTKRNGENLYELYWDSSQDILVYDFDNSSSANDTIGQITGQSNLGLGNAEVMTAPGDSGGPTLLNDQIAGVTSFRARLTFGDIDSQLNSSFGEIGGDTRVSVFASWIDSITDEPGAPQVTNVIISNTVPNSPHTPFSFDTVDGSGLQLRTVPVGGADTVSIQFDDHVMNIDGDSLTLTGLTTGDVPTLATGGFSYDVVTHPATWTFDAPFDADQYLLSLSDSVTDVASNALDGEWANPFSVTTTNALVSEFPSGNGTAGGDFNFVFTILAGDHDLDNDGDGAGFLWWQRNYAPDATDKTFAEGDFDGDGDVDGDDLALWQSSYGMNLRDLIFADFNNDGVVDGDDEDIWDTWEGTGTTHAQGDADGDGAVDAADLAILQMQFGLQLKWVA